MNNATNMLPCPMCGCSNINVKNEQPTDNSGGYFIECPDCGISTSLRYACGDDPTPLLAEQWNRRATAQCLLQIAEPQKFTVDSEMSRAFEIEYGQDWKDPDWRRETGVWASAWHKATNAARAAAPQAVQPAVPERGEVLVTVSGFTGSGKSAIAGEIEIMCRALGLQVEWPDGVSEKNMTGADWQTSLELYKPRVRIVESNLLAAPAHPAEGVPAQAGKPLRDLALGVTSFLDHAGFDTSHLPAGMGAALRRLRDAAIATQPAAQGMDALTQAARDVMAERARQITTKGYEPDADDGYEHGELAFAAATYAVLATNAPKHTTEHLWPWSLDSLKVGEPRRMLVKAGALIQAAIEREDRAAQAKQGGALV